MEENNFALPENEHKPDYDVDFFDDFVGDDDDNVDFAQLNAARNRKNKKAGGWQALGLDQPVFKGITRFGYKQPTEIQRKAIPLILDGRDLVGMSRTGSGKTAAFVVPMLQKLKQRDTRGFRALLLSPTRELALQTFRVVKDLGRFTGLRCVCLIGGDDMEEQFSALHEHPDIIIATPGRLLHIVVEMNLKLSSIQYLVFDEADRLFEMGFAEQLHDILKRVPDSRQTMLFSATLPKMLIEFTKAGLSNPVLVRLDVESKISENLKMHFITCRPNDKIAALLFLCRWAVRTKQQTIVFCATMKHVEYITSICKEGELDCSFLYSQLDPTARKINIARFRNQECYLLVVTDIAARGVDIPLLDVAINFHFSPTAKLFVHRVGRVARAGRAGMSFSLITPDELPYVADLFLFLNRPLKFLEEKDQKSIDTREIPLGRFPENLVHLETEFLKTINDISTDITDLHRRSENAMKKYERTRPQPSMESIRRIKSEFRNVTPAIHPFFVDFLDNNAADERSVLEGISNWRPNATIFELNTGSKQQPAAVMKLKRKADQNFINEKRKKLLQEAKNAAQNKIVAENTTDENVEKPADNSEIIEVFDEILNVTKFNTSISSKPSSKKAKQAPPQSNRKLSYNERVALEKQKHYISYVPSDVHNEAALAVKSAADNFDKEAQQVSVDICADDDEGMYRDQKKKVWDRKRKKFVTAEDPKAKKIRTEEGTWVPASYRSGRYEEWKKKNKVNYAKEDDDDFHKNRGRFNKRFGKRGGFNNTNDKRGKNELKNADQIIKQRKQKARVQKYQDFRRKENIKHKGAPRGGQKAASHGADGGSSGKTGRKSRK